jgi:hypothetical protein
VVLIRRPYWRDFLDRGERPIALLSMKPPMFLLCSLSIEYRHSPENFMKIFFFTQAVGSYKNMDLLQISFNESATKQSGYLSNHLRTLAGIKL